MSLDYKSIGLRIKKYRLLRGKSQEQLAEMAGLSRSHISYIENGVKAVSLESLVEISNALEVSADEFLVDNMDFPKSLNDNDASYILLDCTPQESEIITRNMRNLRESLRAYRITKNN
ncbi:MAG: helix-turn-helix transcriptional regulator [Spirochaetales bacterium]|nr:helix-turn-helix transcriptional regulator [Spirochaetales bacterium]